MIFVRYLFRVLRYLTTFRVPEHVHDRIDEIIGRVVSEEEENHVFAGGKPLHEKQVGPSSRSIKPGHSTVRHSTVWYSTVVAMMVASRE